MVSLSQPLFIASTFLSLVFFVILFILVNYLIYLLLELIIGRGLLALAAIFLTYYFLIRKVVTYIIFPGYFPIYRRKLEVQNQEQMGKHVLD